MPDDPESQAVETAGPLGSTTTSTWRIPSWFRRLGVLSWYFIGIVLALSLVVALLGATSDLVAPVTMAAVLAVVFQPLAERLVERGVPRPLAAVSVLIGLIIVVVATIWLVAANLVQQAAELGAAVDAAIADIQRWIEDGPIDAAVIDRIRDATSDNSETLIGGAGRTVVSVFDTAFGFVAGSILGAVVLYYLLKDLPSIAARVVGPEEGRTPQRELIRQIGRQSAHNVRRYYKGRTILALVNGLSLALAALVLDVPAVAAIGLVNFVGSYIPYLGGFVGGAFAVLLALGDEGVLAAVILLAVALAVNLLLENLLEPALIGDALRLHPLAVLLATTLGGITVGMLGLILAAPLTAIALDAQRQLRDAGFFDR